jgi:four helix bundle protein
MARELVTRRSKAEWVVKTGIVVEQAGETVFWLEMLSDSEIVPLSNIESLLAEAKELTAIVTASRRTTRSNA